MKKMFRGLVLLGAAVGAVVLVRNALSGGDGVGEEAVQITLSDGALKSLSTKDIEGQEFLDIARKLVESGV